MTDLVTFGETSLRMRPAGEGRLETATDVRMEASGVESNVACAATRLGVDAAWLSKLPDTPLGHRVERELHSHGIETAVAWADSGRQSLQFLEHGSQPREGRHLEDRGGSAVETVEPGELPMDRVRGAGGVFVAGSTLALSETAAATAGAVLRASDGFAALDLDYRSGLWSLADARETYEDLFPAVDVLVADESALETVFDRTGDPRETAHTVASNGGFEMIVVTRRDRGAVVWYDSVVHEQEGIETQAVDPSGGHEAFVGAFLARILDGANTDAALATGVASAALARTIPGPMTTVDATEIEALAADLRNDR